MSGGNYDQDSLLKQAQNIWTMLDEMAESDPQAYRKFIEKQTNEGKEYMKPPEPHMCVQTMMLQPDRMPYFINFFCWNRVPEPKTPEDAVPVGGTSVFRESGQQNFSYSAVAFNPKILEEYGLNTKYPNDRDTLINLAIDYIHNQQKVTLSRSYTMLGKDVSHRGNLRKMQKGFTGKSDEEFDDQLTELEKSFGPLGAGAKDSLLNKLSDLSMESSATQPLQGGYTPSVGGITMEKLHAQVDHSSKKEGLIQEITTVNDSGNNQKSNLSRPNYDIDRVKDGIEERLVVSIQLPGVTSVGECELDISEDDLELEVPQKYFLHLKLPKEITESEASAKFLKKSGCLKLTLPVKG